VVVRWRDWESPRILNGSRVKAQKQMFLGSPANHPTLREQPAGALAVAQKGGRRELVVVPDLYRERGGSDFDLARGAGTHQADREQVSENWTAALRRS
jgi:hypothetical protein